MIGAFLDLDTVTNNDLDFSAIEKSLPTWHFYASTPTTQVAERIANVHVVITNKVILDQALLKSAKNLKLICIIATGTNNVDLKTAKELGIAVTNITNYATPAVVQHVFCLILTLTTRILEHRQAVNDGQWKHHFCILDYPFRELAGKVIGIVGFGTLGKAVAEVGKAFGMDIKIAMRPGTVERLPGRAPLVELLPAVDILSLHCPLTPQTHGLIGKQELGMMKNDAILINTARGGIVDEAALLDSLQCGQIAGAGVDVLTTEPPNTDNPLLSVNLPNLLITPHVAWASHEARQRAVDATALNIVEFLQGRLRNRVI